MTRSNEQFDKLWEYHVYVMEHNIVLKAKLAIAGVSRQRIFNILFGGEYKDDEGNTITTAADYNLRGAIIDHTDQDPESPLLSTFNRVHDQLVDVRHILKGEGYE